MAEPPRLPAILVPWENSIIYFVTICVKDRRKVLATPEVFGAIKTAIPQLRKHLRPQSWEWQRGCFDRLLRSDDNLRSKWIYVKDHPVRHGFVHGADGWPYYLDFINEPVPGSCQLPLQDPRVQFSGVGGR
jgi:hypothetical protein